MPAWDMAWGFRGTALYVSDPPYQVPGLGEAYPHTYTDANGDSVNAGWDAAINIVDRSNTNDPRIAGINYIGNVGATFSFKIALDSGSAPGAGDYAVDQAFGDTGWAHTNVFQVLDTSTVLIDGTGGGAGLATTPAHYLDATLTSVAATTTWTGTPVTKSFATTLAKVSLGMANVGENTCLAHFRLTKQEAGGPETPTRRLSVRGA